MADLSVLQAAMGVSFNSLPMLHQALVHSSYVNENPGAELSSNERLEFLGDAVLGLVVAEKLYRDYPELTEGDMTQLRSALVRRETLARVAAEIGLGNYLYLGKGEEASGGRSKPANMAAVLEAVAGALFLDSGLDVARDFTLRVLDKELLNIVRQKTDGDYKSQLQHLIQSKYQQPPTYQLIEATGPDHDRTFTVAVMAGDKVLGRGSGRSKKLAETEAARSALEHLPAG